jgi:dTDP-4-dehydrorhamnose reductase
MEVTLEEPVIKVFLTGSGGQLGSELNRILANNTYKYMVFAPSRNDLDLVEFGSVERIITQIKPDVIIHTAAYTNVVQAEIDKPACYENNVVATSNLVEAAKLVDAAFVYVSTDFVFDGKLTRPYRTEDATRPLNYYGKCKLMAEKLVQSSLSKYFIVRTSWLFSYNQGNFFTKILKAAKENDEISVVSDEIGSPTSTIFLSKVILSMIDTKDFGVYHVSNKGICSRYEFAVEIIRASGVNCNVISSESPPNPLVIRPKYSALENNWSVKELKHQTLIEALDEVLSMMKNENIL